MASLSQQKKHLSFSALKQAISLHFHAIKDSRVQGKCDYSQHDVLMSAFACMYFQDPSLSEFQKQMEEEQNQNNLRTLFNVEKIPKNSQLRDILDLIPSKTFAPAFKDLFERLRRHKHLEEYAILPNTLLCVIDGTQYYSSKQIHCDCCLHKEHRTGEITYSHAVLQGAIMHPDKKQVLPVMPEAIQNTDGTKKQDCESNAAKRFIANLKKAHPRQGFMICGDGLMSHQPMIEDVIEEMMHYLLVAKPGDHTYLFEWLEAFSELPSMDWIDEKGHQHHYRWKNNVPLHGEENAIEVNFFEYTLTNTAGKIIYRNSWVTDIKISEHNIQTMTQAGRCRWKIENECFNTLKNQGYHIEHNYGHGKKHLSFNMYLLTLLAFYFHQIFELTDGTYQACRKKFGSKKLMWEKFRGVITFFVMDSWEHLMDFLLYRDDYEEMRPVKIRK
ncbi:transposase family protein [sulfur-oxidizing endosymbiont of Gigantopelta aegis]|uniref:transposase family protein n=2 Tax=sulfur-oxidizing endosymbiont of Gigantopelta aegis TaxID=2794934 RepID=UPI0018DE6D84|nr:transposase family protein [sulfur-oxidizing endosymbiont of Gigantopelta aegis]